jgi:hypothetical protein
MTTGFEPATFEGKSMDSNKAVSRRRLATNEFVQIELIDDQQDWAGLETASRVSTCLNHGFQTGSRRDWLKPDNRVVEVAVYFPCRRSKKQRCQCR